MQSILKAIELKKELDGLRPLTKDQEEKIWQKFRLDWNYHSSHLEGNSLTFGETKNLILHNITAQGKPLKDHIEITGHNEALNWILDVIKEDRPLTENFIRELHKLLLKEPYEVEAITPDGKPTRKKIEIGKYKTTANHVKTTTGEIFRFAEPEETAAKMFDLLNWYKAKRTEADVNPILLSAEFHHKFIIIHPFDDGNGRMARILMNFILMSFAYPPTIIKTEDKNNYFFALRQADNGDIEFFVDYIAQNLIRSLELMIAGAKGESIEEPVDLDKSIALLEHKLKGIGERPKTFKSKEKLLNLFNNHLPDLIILFITSNEKLNKFYATSEIYLNIDGQDSVPPSYVAAINFIKKRIENTSTISNIKLTYRYCSFSYSQFEEFSAETYISFEFTNTRYVVKNKETTYTKTYDEILSGEEMNNLVNQEIKNHTIFIEEKIREFENKKNSNT